MAKAAVAVGQHHLIRSYLPWVVAVLLGCALALVGVGLLTEQHTGNLVRSMAQKAAPGHLVAGELDLAVGETALASVLSAQTGDDRQLADAMARLDAAALSYDGWLGAIALGNLQPVGEPIRAFEERLAVATARDPDPVAVELALSDIDSLLRANRRACAADTARVLERIAESQERRRWIEVAVLALLTSGCLALLFAARRREERCCDDEKSQVRELEQTNADLEAFAGRVAHDLRNPLVPILSGSQVIERTAVDGQVRRAAERIERSARRIASMIDMLLDFSKMSTMTPPVESAVAPIIEDVVDGFREKAYAQGATIEVHCEPGLHALAEPIVVASPLQNLVENALKYGRRAEDPPVVEVRAFARAGMVLIEVEDRGPGIGAAEAEQLFHAFQRLGQSGEGVGLGLATARRLVEARGGSVGLRVGRFGGALFQVRLPAARNHADELAAPASGGALPA